MGVPQSNHRVPHWKDPVGIGSLCGGSRPLTAYKGVQHQEKGQGLSWSGGCPLFRRSRPLTAQKTIQHQEKGEGLSWCGPGPRGEGSRPLKAQKGAQQQETGKGLSWCGAGPPLKDPERSRQNKGSIRQEWREITQPLKEKEQERTRSTSLSKRETRQAATRLAQEPHWRKSLCGPRRAWTSNLQVKGLALCRLS